MKIYIIYIALFIVGWKNVSAQEILIQWTGVVRNELLEPIPHTHIIAQRDFRPAVSDRNGVFTIITYPSDTLMVTSIGYKPLKIPVPAFTNEDARHYIMDIIMDEEIILLRDLVIFPWRTYREFREAFVALELPEDDMQRAYRNISVMQEQIINAIANRQASPTSNFRDFNNQRVTRMMSYGHMFPTYSITNPIAWAQFFQALQSGDFTKRDDAGGESRSSVIEDVNRENINR